MILVFDGGWLRTASTTSTGHTNAQREVGRLVLKPPSSVSTLAFRKSVLENAITDITEPVFNIQTDGRGEKELHEALMKLVK